jgi:hypothetical protein
MRRSVTVTDQKEVYTFETDGLLLYSPRDRYWSGRGRWRVEHAKTQHHALTLAIALRNAREMAMACGYKVAWGEPVAWSRESVTLCRCLPQLTGNNDERVHGADLEYGQDLVSYTYEYALNVFPHASRGYLHIGNPVPYKAVQHG